MAERKASHGVPASPEAVRIGTMLRAKGRPSRIDSEFYQAKLSEGAGDLLVGDDDTSLDKSLLVTVRKIHFVGADDMAEAPEDKQIEMYVTYAKMLTNLMDEASKRKAPLPIRAPAQICVAAVVAAELIRRMARTDFVLVLVEHLLEQLEYAAAYYLEAGAARGCNTLNEMLDLLQKNVAGTSDSTLAASASLVVAFSGLMHGIIGMGDLGKPLATVDANAADGLWYFLEQGYRFFGLPPVICQILEARLGAAL